MPKGRPRVNLALEEAEIKKSEELNRRKKKALDEQAELLRQENALADARAGEEEAQPENTVTSLVSEQFADILEGLEEDGKFWVFRIDEKGRSSQCGAWPVADWPVRMEEVAHDAGGGTFKIQFKTASGKFVKQTTLTFDPKFYGKKEVQGSGTDLTALIMGQAAEARREAADARRETADLMKTLLVALTAPKEGGFIKSAQDIAVIGTLFDKKGGGTAEAMEMLKTGIDLGMRMAEGKEPTSGFDRLLETIGEPAGKILSRLAENPRMVRAAPLAATPKPITDALPAPEPPPVDPVKEHPFYKQYVPKILAAAKANEDPAEWAENILNIVPGVYHDSLLGYFEKPDIVEILGGYEPEARNFAPWITSVRNEVMKLFTDEEKGIVSAGVEPTESRAVGPRLVPLAETNGKREIPQALQDALNE